MTSPGGTGLAEDSISTDAQRGARMLDLPAPWWPSSVALALGIAILAAVGFAPGIAHNAAHDVRHTAGFPCH